MGDQPVEVTLHLSERQLRLLADARDRLAPELSLESFVARAIAEQEAPPDAAPGRHMDAPAPQPGLVWPGAAAALELHRGDVVRIEQVAGGQCVDLVAWSLPDPRERLSAARTRAIAGISPGTGDELWSGPPYERPLLALIADSAPGHDLLFPACSAGEYAAVGCLPEPSCVAVQAAAAAAWGLEVADLPDPLNLWLRADVSPDGSLGWHSTPTVPGDHVELVAHASLLVIVNPCVDDVFGCSGLEPHPIVVTARAFSRNELVGPPPIGGPSPYHELVVALPSSSTQPSAATVRATAVRFSLAVLAGSNDLRDDRRSNIYPL